MPACPNCNTDLFDSARFCDQCGQPTSGETGAIATNRQRFRPTHEIVDDEEIGLWSGTFCSKAMVGWWILAVFATVAIPILALVLQLPGEAWLIVLCLLAAVWLFPASLLIYRRLSVYYELTNQRFVHKSGILNRKTNRIEVIDMDDVSYQQGIVERMLGTGSIRIQSSDTSHPKITLDGIDNVEHVAQLIDDARRKERVRRGLHIEAV